MENLDFVVLKALGNESWALRGQKGKFIKRN